MSEIYVIKIGGMIPKINVASRVVDSGHRSLICHYSNLTTILGPEFIGTEIT